jgi:hypothetical protein
MFINWETNVSDDYILRITDGGTAVQVEVNNSVCLYYKSIYLSESRVLCLKHTEILFTDLDFGLCLA